MKTRQYFLVGLLFITTISLIYSPSYDAFAITYQPAITIQNPTSNPGDFFGTYVDISGSNFLVAADFDDAGATNAGAAYLFDGTTGTLQITFLNPSIDANDNFGASASISGNNVVIGAFFDDTSAPDAGIAYLFDITTCDADTSNGGVPGDNICEAPTTTFLNPTPAVDDRFGNAADISGNNVVIGANLDDTGATNAGAAYLFDITTCDSDTSNGGVPGDNICEAPTTTFQKIPPTADDTFGNEVSISGNNVLAGVRNDDIGSSNAGAAYLFDATTGTLLTTFLNPTPATDDRFGIGASISGNNVLVGADFDDDTTSVDAGAAYLFDITTCDADTSNGGVPGDNICEAPTTTFQNPTPAADDGFGIEVSLSGNNVLISAYRDDVGATNAGAVYLFDAITGSLLNTFLNPTPTSGDEFGYDVSISGNRVIIGADFDDIGATNAGAAYLFLVIPIETAINEPINIVELVSYQLIPALEPIIAEIISIAEVVSFEFLTGGPGGGPVGGTSLPIDMNSLLVAGISTNSSWIIPVIVSVVGITIAVFSLKKN